MTDRCFFRNASVDGCIAWPYTTRGTHPIVLILEYDWQHAREGSAVRRLETRQLAAHSAHYTIHEDGKALERHVTPLDVWHLRA